MITPTDEIRLRANIAHDLVKFIIADKGCKINSSEQASNVAVTLSNQIVDNAIYKTYEARG